MDTLQKKDMMEKYAELKNRVFTVIEFGRDGQIPKMQDIQDPTGREPERYRQFCRQAEAETERIIHELMYRTAPS
jgi:protein-tyrosine-phosphatase